MEEKNQETTGKTGLTNDSKVSILLLAVAAIVWVFVPFFKGDMFRVTALEMLAGPIFESWDTFTQMYFGKLTYSEYVEMMSASREFWIAISACGCVVLGVVASLRSSRKYAFILSILGILASVAPMIEIVIYMIKSGFMIPAHLLLGLFGAFDWGYWMIAAIFVIVAILNRKKKISE